MLKDKLFGVISLGCDKNRVDSEKMLSFLKEKGCKITNNIEEAQILIVNTCAFLNSSRKESIDTIVECNQYRTKKLEKLVVTGCLPQKFIDQLFEPLTEGDVFLGYNDYDQLLSALEESYQKGVRVNRVGQGKGLTIRDRVLTTEEHYAYLKIADGCYNHCTYCLIPKIRGKYRSTPMEELLEEAKGLGDLAELIIVAQDSTRYGEDLYGENKFVELLRKISDLDNIRHIRLLYCYPDAIDDKLISEIKNNPKILKYIDIPLQHSEDRILKLMNRKGNREDYLQLLNKIKKEIPEIAIRSTFICGFPSETEEESIAMGEFLKQAKFVNCGFFAYSKEPDTAAYKMKNHLPARVKEKRVKALYSIQQKISEEFLHQFIGKEIKVLCDGIDYDKSCFIGRAYFNAPDIDGKVYFNAKVAEQGEEYIVKIEKADAYDLYGKTEDYQNE